MHNELKKQNKKYRKFSLILKIEKTSDKIRKRIIIYSFNVWRMLWISVLSEWKVFQ